METTVAKSRSSIFPLIFFLVFLAITALATLVSAAGQTPKTGSGQTGGVAIE
jgi:hypothetical protein